MEDRHDNRRDHVLRRPLTATLEQTISDGGDVATMVEAVLATLSEHRIIDYAPAGALKLLTPAGRVLTMILTHPGITVREMSVKLGTTESGVNKSLNALLRGGFIARTKVGGRNSYRFNLSEGLKHPDITHFYLAIYEHLKRAAEQAPAITPSEQA